MKIFTRKLVLSVCCLLSILKVRSQTDVLTQHNDLSRTGWNSTETILNTTNVTPTNFGILYKHTVDDQIYAQPLVVNGITVTDPLTKASVKRNLLIVVTVQNTMYAFDADNGTLDPYWKINFTPPGTVVPSAGDIHSSLCNGGYTDFQGNGYGQKGAFGVVGTPTIDKSSNTIYVVSRYRDLIVDNNPRGTVLPNGKIYDSDDDWDPTGFYQQLNALDLSTGTHKGNSPVLIDRATTTVPGTAPGNDNGLIHFDPRRENQRGGLFITNGIVYITYAAHCDMDNYNGWILGYKLSDLSQVIRYVSSPNDGRAGIWMAGNAPAVDASGNIFFSAGNGVIASSSTSPANMALSAVKTTPDLANHTLTNVSWYKPDEGTYHAWNESDLDIGTGLILIPNSNLMVTAHKSGKLILLSQNIPAPGGAYDESSSYFKGYYDLGAGSSAGSHSSLVYWGGANKQYIYQFSENTHVQAFPVNIAGQKLDNPIVNTTVPISTISEGGYASVSSNGTDVSTGILWVANPTGGSGGTVHALKADDITQELWNSDNNGADQLGNYAKMCPPTIANGKVYVATFANSLNVYGLLESNTRCITNIALAKTYSDAPTVSVNFPAANAFDDKSGTYWASGAVGNTATSLIVDLGSRFDLCKTSIHWNNVNGNSSDYAIDFTVDISEDGTNWTSMNTVTDNSFTANPAVNEFNEHSTGRYVRVHLTRGFAGGYGISEFQVFGTAANNCVSPDANKMTVTNLTTGSATLGFTPVAGITKYVIRYKSNAVASYITKTLEDLSGSGNPLSLNINGLTCGAGYIFTVQSDCGSGLLSVANTQSFTTVGCNPACLNFTRYNHADLGDVQIGGMSCYSEPTPGDGTFTVTGAGVGLGQNADQFQFNFTGLDNDIQLSGRIASQDAGLATSQAGLMMRDSVTDISRFIFIGKTGDGRIVFIYRATPGGPAVTTYFPNPQASTYFRIQKLGTQYTAFYGNTSGGPWVQAGTSLDLGFGNQTISIGMAVSSTSPGATTTAVFKEISENLTTLPVQLLNFSANNQNNEFINLTWQTTMELSNNYFQVERSTDGEKFDSLISIKSLGNSTVIQSYSARDLHPYKGVNFYRLKQIDIDGRFTYSSVVTVKFGIGNDPVIYPNPVKTLFTAIPGDEIIREIVIYNVQGRAVQFVMGTSTLAEMKVNVSLLGKGVYILKLKTDSKNYQFKMIKE